MRRPFSRTHPVNPETVTSSLFPDPARTVRFRAIYCGVRTGPDDIDRTGFWDSDRGSIRKLQCFERKVDYFHQIP